MTGFQKIEKLSDDWSVGRVGKKAVVTVTPQSSIQEAAKRMRDFHVGDVVVVSEEGVRSQPIGIITDRDIVLSTVAFGLAPDEVCVSDIMLRSLTTARSSDTVFRVLNIMKEQGIRRVPLVDETGTLMGIVSSEDIFEFLTHELSDVAQITEKQHTVENERRRRLA